MIRFRSYLTPSFRNLYGALPPEIQRLAAAKYQLFQQNPFHASLEFRPKGKVWTVAVGRSYRAIARRSENDLHWVWIGSHEAYNELLGRMK